MPRPAAPQASCNAAAGVEAGFPAAARPSGSEGAWSRVRILSFRACDLRRVTALLRQHSWLGECELC